MGARVTVVFQGGPWDGRAMAYSSPLPDTLVMAVPVPASLPGGMPGLEYHDYHALTMPGSRRRTVPVAPYIYVWAGSAQDLTK